MFKDNRFTTLCIKLQSSETAIGALVMAWIVAQEFWKHSQNGIPKSAWKKRLLCNELIACGLAEDRGEFVYMCGSKRQFAWLTQRVEAGRKGGSTRNSPVIGNHKVISEATAKRGQADAKPPTLPPPPSPPPSLSLSLTQKQRKEENTVAAQPSAPPDGGAHDKIAYFAERWKEKYRGSYTVIPKEAGLVKNSFKGMGLDRFKSLVDAYFQMHEGGFLAKRHDITSLAMNVPKISLFAQNGIKVTRHDINQIELREHNSNVFSKLEKERETK